MCPWSTGGGVVAMKIFVDSANLSEIEAALTRGIVRGITTNPSILAKEKRRDYREHIRELIQLVEKWDATLPISVEVFTTDVDEMLRQTEDFLAEFGGYAGLTVKVPIGWDELRVVSALTEKGVKVNATCGMSLNQAVMALNAGAHIVTVPPKFFPQMSRHPKTDEVVEQFVTEFAEWMS